MMKRPSIHARSFASLLVIFCMLAAPLTAFAKKGEKNFKSGMQYEAAQQWEKAAQEYTLAVASDPSNVEYQLHYRRAVFNASQTYMQQGRALAEQRDYIGAYNAFRQAYGYDPVNELALSEMARMLRLQREKTGESDVVKGNGLQTSPTSYQEGTGGTPAQPGPRTSIQQDPTLPPARTEQLRVIKYTGDLKAEIRNLTEQLGLNVIFDSQSFRTPRTVEVNYSDVTTAQALDLIFLQEGLFFQKVNRRTILVADQNRRAQYQQLVIRTFYLANIKPEDARNVIAAAIPPNQGRPQTVVLPDKDTNSITIRDTPENLRLIGDILQSIDKDRAEVVMDVSIYEVSRSDLLQLGNQIGTGDSGSGGLFNLGGSSGLNILGGARDVATRISNAPTAFGAALVLPASVLTAFQSKNHTRLLASTQVHAFNNEESTARIGQRVPVQTAQTFPFANTSTTGGTTTGGVTGGVNFGGGFPVIQYEPTGLTLKFQPQVFPNLDVQVKMSIESKDILGAGSLTPTFTERTITGTARIQNNRTMMIASVAQDSQSNGRRGLPLLGLIPVLGRLFTSPTRNNTQVDIVIAVTPRVLRAPAITPSDEIERPSGTLQTPTNSSLEAMVQENDREDQLAAARRLPTNVVVQLPDVEPPPAYGPAPKGLIPTGDNAGLAQPVPAKTETAAVATPASAMDISQPSNALANAIAQLTGEAPPMPTALVNKRVAATTPSRLNLPTVTLLGKAEAAPGSSLKNQAGSEKSSIGEKLKAGLLGKPPAPLEPLTVEARLMPGQQEMHVGEKQRIALVLVSKEPLGNAILRLRFDPRYVAVRNVAPGNWPDAAATQPSVMQSIDPAGIIAVAISPQAGTSLKTGANVVLFLDIEAVAAGESVISFDQANAQVVASDGRAVKLQMMESRVTVK
ncbi:MAG: ral secretion pathway protein [Acidobacteriota bacterium]|jgi:general secretion pathway protein D|nr:ral secretion pathway protein [Acidobacteriota bacterium]